MTKFIKNTISILLLTITLNSLSQTYQFANKKIDTLFSEWSNINSPGCAVGVLKEGEVLFKKGYGNANLDYNIPITSNTSFQIASLSKQFTASCLAILILEKQINLEDDIHIYLPDFPRFNDTIKIKHLIYHTSGLKDYPEMMSYTGNSLENYNSYENVFDILYTENSLVFKPGEKFEYGNHGYTLMVKIIENVTGMSINEFASKRIFEPLGMSNTFYNENTRITIKNKSIAYDKSLNGDYQKHYINTPCVGSGNIITTLDDLLLWEKNFHDNKIFPKGYIDLVTQKGVLNNGDTLSYAFGIGHGDYKGHKTISHSGSVNCYESKILRIPNENLSVVILSNVYYIKDLLDNNNLAEKVAGLYFSNSQNNNEVKIRKTNFNNYPTSQINTDFSGTYKSDKGITWIFKKENKYRIVHSFNDWFDSMLPVNDSLCVDEYATDDFYKFKLAAEGNVVSLDCPYTGLAKKVGNIFSNEALRNYQGMFYSEELNSMFKFYQADKKLYCRVNNNTPIEIFYISDSKLKLENLLIEPTETKDGLILKLMIYGDMGGSIIVSRLN